jgi:heat-inducible transcriptional repressor
MTEQLESEEDIKRLLQATSETLSKVTKLAALVMIPRTEQRAYRHVEFLPLNENRVLVILVFSDREVQNRVIQTDRGFSAAELTQAANYLNSTFAGKDIKVVKEELLRELRKAHEEMNRTMQAMIEVTQKALEAGEQGEGYVLAGQTNLMEIGEWSSIERLRQLFDAFNQKRAILQLLDQAMNARGVQIFFGEESGYGALDHCSVVTSTYDDDENHTIGVLGVIGPTRMEYDRVIPIVRVTARMLSSALKSLS